MDRLSDHLQASGVSPRSSSRSMLPTNRLNTITEVRNAADQPVLSFAKPHAPEQRGPEGPSFTGREPPVAAPRRHSSNRSNEEEGGQTEPVPPPQLPPPRVWMPDNQDTGENGAGNPLLRQSSQEFGGSKRF